jgi:hypothetical protein
MELHYLEMRPEAAEERIVPVTRGHRNLHQPNFWFGHTGHRCAQPVCEKLSAKADAKEWHISLDCLPNDLSGFGEKWVPVTLIRIVRATESDEHVVVIEDDRRMWL